MSRSLVNLQSELTEAGIDVLRVVYADIIGTVRSKDLLVSQLDKVSHGGPTFCQGVWVTTTQGGVLDGGDVLSDGLEDFVTQIVPESWRALPWEPGVAYVVAGANNPDMTPNEFAPRTLLERITRQYAELGLTPVVGPELEFYIADRNEDGSFRRALTQPGRVYTSGATVDPKGTFLHLLRMLDQLRIGVFAGNHE
ncbi:MAG: glutamine synthetase, partial [Actinomycetes bacterium]